MRSIEPLFIPSVSDVFRGYSEGLITREEARVVLGLSEPETVTPTENPTVGGHTTEHWYAVWLSEDAADSLSWSGPHHRESTVRAMFPYAKIVHFTKWPPENPYVGFQVSE